MTERKFKIGDRVRIIGQRKPDWGDCPAKIGDTGMIINLIIPRLPCVQLDNEDEPYHGVLAEGWALLEHEIELIKGGN